MTTTPTPPPGVTKIIEASRSGHAVYLTHEEAVMVAIACSWAAGLRGLDVLPLSLLNAVRDGLVS